jgi:acyl-CoA thioesterase I
MGTSLAQTDTPARRPVLVLGDSLSAEYGLKRGTGWVALMEKWLVEEGMPSKIVNASISGDTTSGGRSRLPALLAEHKPALVIVELGGNDALRGLPLQMTEDNLRFIVRASLEARAKVMLLGMQVPPNYGRDHANRFAAIYTNIAKTEKVTLIPFFLRGVADIADPTRLFQPDRIHPNEAAQQIMVGNVVPHLYKLLR